MVLESRVLSSSVSLQVVWTTALDSPGDPMCVLQSPAPGLASPDTSLPSLAGALSARLLPRGQGLGSRAGWPVEEKMLQISCSSWLLQPARGSGSLLLPTEGGPGLPRGHGGYPRQNCLG